MALDFLELAESLVLRLLRLAQRIAQLPHRVGLSAYQRANALPQRKRPLGGLRGLGLKSGGSLALGLLLKTQNLTSSSALGLRCLILTTSDLLKSKTRSVSPLLL